MKNLLFLTTLFLSSITFSQNLQAGIIGLSCFDADVYLSYSTATSDAPKCYVNNGESYNDSIIFSSLTSRIDSLMNLLSFDMIDSDKITGSDKYKELAADYKKREQYMQKVTPQSPAKGYGFIDWGGVGVKYLKEYFEIEPTPDLVIVAYTSYDLRLSKPVSNNQIQGILHCDVMVYGYTNKSKQVVRLKAKHSVPFKLDVQIDSKTCWGWSIVSDFGAIQTKAFEAALNLLGTDLTKAQKKINKAFSK